MSRMLNPIPHFPPVAKEKKWHGQRPVVLLITYLFISEMNKPWRLFLAILLLGMMEMGSTDRSDIGGFGPPKTRT